MDIVGISHDDQVEKVLLYLLFFPLRYYSDNTLHGCSFTYFDSFSSYL